METETDWARRGACRDLEPMEREIFFPLAGDGGQEAKRVCATCEVSAECLAFALRTHEEHGVWGGYNASERRRMQSGPDIRSGRCRYCDSFFTYEWQLRPGYKSQTYCNDTCLRLDRRARRAEWRASRKAAGMARI